MKVNKDSSVYIPSDEEREYISTISHRHDVDRKIEGLLEFYGKPDVSKLKVVDTNLDFEMDLDNGLVSQDVDPNNDYQCSGSASEQIPSSEILGLQFVDRLQSQDKNFNPLGWQEVQQRLGLDRNFDPIPAEP